MHGHDPVKWKTWNSEILTTAQQQNKLIFVSSGYFSCHWCHVMQRENYQDKATANYLNQHFISVKIDRELNPELDKTLIDFAKKTTGQAGWPQHVVLTPSGYPFASFIYLPNKNFNQTMRRIVTLWQTQPKQVETLAKDAALSHIKQTNIAITNKPISTEAFTNRLLEQVRHSKDELSGGLKSSAKFPKAPLLNALLKIKNLPEDIEDWLLVTLEQMQSEHLFDHIHGGFYRYTIDPNWQIPHFEKMAYDNALLATTYLLAGQRWQREDFLETSKMTLAYMDKHLYSEKIQMYQSSQSAIDKHNEEGGDYLWNIKALQSTLTEKEFDSIDQAWSLNEPMPYELGWHPSPIASAPLWQSIRNKLQTPVKEIPIDNKTILGWNALILSALSQAYATLNEEHYKQRAYTLAQKLSALITAKNPPRALSKEGESMGEANLQDYAFIKKALEDYQALTGDLQFTNSLKLINQHLVSHFTDKHGWRYDATPILPQQTGTWAIKDGPIPSPTAYVNCLNPQIITPHGERLIAQALNYPSYLESLKCIQAANPVK